MPESIISVDEKYQVQKPLGGGGFSDVFLVDGPSGICALKLLKGTIESLKKSALEEFKNEFAVLKDMRHPNIAAILDFGFDEQLERYYYTSELIEGKDLIKASDGMAMGVLTDLFVQALRALSYLHSFRIYHFDIKAANVLVVKSGDKPAVKIIDFGLAGIDPRGRLIGTPSYMAPEIVAREPADGRADLYSLGVLWYAAITRTNPFKATTSTETLSRQQRLVPPAPSHEIATVPAWLDAVIMRLLEKNPADRFHSAAAVIREINRLSGSSYPLETRETLLSYLPDEGRFVGRQAEMERLESDLARLKNIAGASSGCMVAGALGTGKTRLLKEFKYRSQLKDIRVEWASAAEEDGFGRWCDSLSEHLISGTGLVAFILDDAHRALDESITRARLISAITRASRPAAGASAWIALATRPIADESLRASIEALLPIHITVDTFTREELGKYLVSLTGLESPPEPLLNGLFDRTEGNPLFVTEMLKSLISGGGLFDDKGRWNEAIFEDVGVDFSKAIIPGTVGGLLLERTSSFSKEARSLLEALAAAGRPATSAELGAWAEVSDPRDALTELVRKAVLDRYENFALRFHNGLLGQAIYESMPQAESSAIHDRIAKYLAEANANEDEILTHVSRGSEPKAAFYAAFKLGQKALAAGRGEQAADYMGRALSFVDVSDMERRAEVQMKLGEAYLISHDYTAATEHFAAVEGLIAACADSEEMARWRADALIRLGGTYIKLQEFDRARAAFHDARGALDQSGGDPRREVAIENFLGTIRYLEGHLEEARRIFLRTRAQSTEIPAERPIGLVTNNDLGVVLLALGELTESKRILDEDLERAEKIGDDLLIGRSFYNMAQLLMAMKSFGEAISSYKRCIDVCRRSHNTELLLRAYNGLGNAFQITGDPDQSLKFYERGMALHERIGDLRGGAAIAINMGLVESARARMDAALDHLVPAVEYLRSLTTKTATDWAAYSRGLLELGDIAKRNGMLDDARGRLEEARRIASQVPQAAQQRFWIMATMAEVAHLQGRLGELSDIMGMLGPMATTDAEKKTLEDLRRRFGGVEAPKKEVKPTPVEQPRVLPQPSAAESVLFEHYKRILDINKLISAEGDLNYVLKTVLYHALEITGAEAGAILLSDETGSITAAHQRNLDGREDEVAFSRTLAKQAIEGGITVRTDDAMADERFARESSVCVHALRSILCIPVRARRRIVGALYLENRFQAGAFAGADMMLLDAFTDQVGLAIETSRLLAESAKKEAILSNELSEASKKAEQYEEMIRSQPQQFKLEYGEIAARSPAMQRILNTLNKISDTEISVFICGESGTGKELIARALHSNNKKRASGRFVAINCGAIPATLIESELFGYKAGAFTGANRDKKGLIEEASGGTLFLDEVSELAPNLQVKLLRVLQERECTRIGDTNTIAVDVRVVAASNQDIEKLMQQGAFREDLYYRVCQIKIEVPPLRERPEDLTVLVDRFIADSAPGRRLSVSPRLMRRFLSYDWPGNARELANLIQVSCALAEGDIIDEQAIPANHPLAKISNEPLRPPPKAKDVWPDVESGARGLDKASVMIDDKNRYDEKKSWSDYECVIIAKCYEANGFKAKQSAHELGVAPATLYSRIKQYGLDDHSSEVYREPFKFEKGRALDDYIPMVFSAALKSAGGRPKNAIANLRVSQGYFYKVMKRARKS